MSHINCSSCGVSFELGIPYSSGSICPDCNYVVHCSRCFRDFPVHQLKDDDGVLFCPDCLNLAVAPVPDSALASSGVAAPITDMAAEYLLMHVRGFEPLQYFVDYEVALSDCLVLTADISKAHHFDDFNEVQWVAILLDIQGYGFSVLLPDGSYSDIYTTAAHSAVSEYYKDEGNLIGDSK